MQQSEWRHQILSIEEDLQRRSRARSSDLLDRFITALNVAVQDFFENHPIENPLEPLTMQQKAFMHALQLYDIQTVQRLIANYDPDQGLKTVLSGIQKSCQSLSVVLRLDDFSLDSQETSQLASYRSRLEKSLLRILDCERKLLYDQKLLSEHLVAVSKLPEEERNWFFSSL